MKVALIQPKIPDGNYLPSMGILYIATLLEKNGFDVRVFDENYDAGIIEGIKKFSPDIAGLTAVTAAVKRARYIASEIKRSLSGRIVTVLGGAHPSAMPEESASFEGVDFVVFGEGEYTMLELCKYVRDGERFDSLNDMPNLCFKTSDGVQKTKRSRFLTGEEIDRLPYPAFHLLDLERVFSISVHGLFAMGRRILPIMTARGCPSLCTFCCRMMGYNLRERSVEGVIEEIKFMKRTYSIDELYIEDDNFCNNKARAIKILDEIIKARLGIYIKFANGLRADSVDEELLSKIKEAGGYWVGFGIESGSKQVLKLMNKNLDLDLSARNVRAAKRAGFFVGSNMIVGYPGETRDDLRESLRYFQRLGLDSCAIVNLIPFPKTPVRALCEKNGYLTEAAKDYDNYYFRVFNSNILVETPHLKEAAARRFIRLFFIRFYLRPDRFYRVLRMFARRYTAIFLRKRQTLGSNKEYSSSLSRRQQ